MVQNSKEAIVTAISSLASSLGDKRLAAPAASLSSSSSMYLFVAPSITDAIHAAPFFLASQYVVLSLSSFPSQSRVDGGLPDLHTQRGR